MQGHGNPILAGYEHTQRDWLSEIHVEEGYSITCSITTNFVCSNLSATLKEIDYLK